MSAYTIPQIEAPIPAVPGEVLLIASGDLRQSANQVCWPAQSEAESAVIQAFAAEGLKVRRAHPTATTSSTASSSTSAWEWMSSPPSTPPPRSSSSSPSGSTAITSSPASSAHRGPILTVANWSGQWPGLVGMLNLNGCLRKAGVKFSTIWTKDFDDPFFSTACASGFARAASTTTSPTSARSTHPSFPPPSASSASLSPRPSRVRKAILGVFDEGCMGMFNAIIEDSLLNPTGVFKERLSQSALVAAMQNVTDAEAHKIRAWLDKSGITFVTGPNEETDLTDAQVLQQCKMYIAALRIADEFGCDAIGIQYQQGLKDLVPASDLVEGLLNNVDRPPAFDAAGKELYAGRPLPHFNEVDECCRPRPHPHQSHLDRHAPRPRHHPPRRPLGRAV